jgi:hypothetical protein
MMFAPVVTGKMMTAAQQHYQQAVAMEQAVEWNAVASVTSTAACASAAHRYGLVQQCYLQAAAAAGEEEPELARQASAKAAEMARKAKTQAALTPRVARLECDRMVLQAFWKI